jgi:cyclic pyranopterin phosphate synthase
MTVDRFGRNINYLRISLTDKCNLRCLYCMPEEMSFQPRDELLQDDEIYRLVRIFAGLGFQKIRLTGGEPTIRANIVEIVSEIVDTPGIKTVAMTTNGLLLKTLSQPLVNAGLSRVNISIDTLNPKKFKTITRWGEVEDVLAGIAAAREAGLGIKINVVVVKGYNDKEDVVELARLTLSQPWQVRFIEMMPFGSVSGFQLNNIVSEEDLRSTISHSLGPLDLVDGGALDGEARLYKLQESKGTLGFISSVTSPFCASCSRARLTADGRLRLCLLRDSELDLLSPMRSGLNDQELIEMIREAVWWKPWGHGLEQDVIPLNRVMSEIGG